MQWHYLFALLPVCLFADAALESESMLYRADQLAKRYASFIAKAPPPAKTPQPDAMLLTASNWLTIDLEKLNPQGVSAFASLNQVKLWELIAEMGFEAVELRHLKSGEEGLLTLDLNPAWGAPAEYAQLFDQASKREIELVGGIVGSATEKGTDFALALKNVGSYPGLYSLIEIDPGDWAMLPKSVPNTLSVNVPWLTLQALRKKGYVPKDFTPYVKESSWNATGPILCADRKTRRWLYLRNTEGFPKLDWLHPSFASERLAAGDVIHSLFQLGQRFFFLGQYLPPNAKETMSLTVRKLGGFSASFVEGGVSAFAQPASDLLYDHLTPMATLHALLAQDAEALRLLYRLMLEEGVQPKTLIHPLEPFGRTPREWTEFLANPQKKYFYFEELTTGEALRQRLLREDIDLLKGKLTGNEVTASAWREVCTAVADGVNLQKKYQQVLELHLLLAKFFAWQPGAFLISAEDLLGSSSFCDLMNPPCDTLYAPLPVQMNDPRSFASQLKAILRVRREQNFERAELLDVPLVKSRGLLVLRYRLPVTRLHALLAINFDRQRAEETFDDPQYVRTTAIDLSTQLAEEKFFNSSLFELKVDSLSAKLILFQPSSY